MNDSERMERKLNKLLELLGIDVQPCPSPDCVNGIDVASYGDEFPCSHCEGTGEILVKRAGDL